MFKKEFFLGSGATFCLFLTIYIGSQLVTGQTAAQAEKPDLSYQISGILYTQKSAEYRALAYQAYNLARWQLDADFDKKNVKKLPKAERKRPRAIVVDIDETVLDNSPSNAMGVVNNRPFNTTDWYAWSKLQSAEPVPGAVDFVNYAVAKGVKIFYISNRDEVQKADTIENLKKKGFNDVSTENVMLRVAGASPKGPRRDIVAAKYRIVLLMGDNLDDFSSAFEKTPIVARFAEADRNRDLWGKKFIVLPNAMYGTWESALYDFNNGMPESQKAERRVKALELP
jgi:5'-nucleotidase (lipoprotein e(P4) family)